MRGQQRKGQRRQQNFGHQGFGPQGGHQQYGGAQPWCQGEGPDSGGPRQGERGYGHQGYGQSSHQYPGSQQQGQYGSQVDDQWTGRGSGARGEDVWERNTGGYPDGGSYLSNQGEGSRYPRGADQYDLGSDFDQHEPSGERFEGGWHEQGSSGGRGSSRGWDEPTGNQGARSNRQGGRPNPYIQGSYGGQGWYGNQGSYEGRGASGDDGSSGTFGGARAGYGSQAGGYGAAGGRTQQGQPWETGSTGSSGQRARGVAPKGYKKSDQRLNEDLGEALMEEGIDCSNVEIQVKDGVVTITGEVSDRSDKYRIEHLAAGMMGVQDVENQLRIAKSSSQTESKPTRAGEGANSGQNPSGAAKTPGDRNAGNRGH